MTPRRVFRLILLVIALGLLARNLGWFPSSTPEPAPAQRRDPVVVEVPPEAIGRTSRAPGTAAAPSTAPAPETASAPRRDLSVDEQRGGHTLERHVGKTDDDLRARLRRERRISAASTYTDRATAERVVAETIAKQSGRIATWTDRRGTRPNLALDFDGPDEVTIGRSIAQGREASESCHDAVVVLRWDTASGDWYVLTSYPEVRRGGR